MNLKPSTIKLAWPNLAHQQYPKSNPNSRRFLETSNFIQLPGQSKNPNVSPRDLLGFRSHDGWEVIEGQGVKHQLVILKQHRW